MAALEALALSLPLQSSRKTADVLKRHAMSADGEVPSRVHSPREGESSNKIYQNPIHSEAFDGGTSHTGREQQRTNRGSPRDRGRAEHQGTEPTIANNHLSHPEAEATFPPRTSSRGRSNAPGEPIGLSLAPSPPQPPPIHFYDPNSRAPSLHTVTPSGADNGIYSAEAMDREQSRRRIWGLQQQLRDDARFHLRKVESMEACYKEELKIQAESHKRELQTRADFHKRELQDALYEKEQSQAARDDAREQAQVARQELWNMRERMVELEFQAQRDKEKHAAELQTALVSKEEAVKTVSQLEERLGLAEDEVVQQRQNILRSQDLELMLEEANSQLSFQSEGCNRLETELRGYKAQIKRYQNLWQNTQHQFKGEKRALLHQIALCDRYISIFDQYQRIYNKNINERFIQNDKELVQLKAVLLEHKEVICEKVRGEIEATRLNYDNLRNSIESTWRCRNALHHQLQHQPDDPDEDSETAESKFSIKQARLKEFQAELGRLDAELDKINATTKQLCLQDQTLSAEIMQLQKDLRKPTNSVQKPARANTTEIKCLRRSLYKLHTEFIVSQRQSNSSLPELVQDDNADDDVDDASDDWHSGCPTPDRLTQVYTIQDDHGRSSIASQMSKKQKRASSYLPPTPWI
ncbi:hypothetical protein DL95DRAFT_498279 [Leptodontidium sp. 2 PMI_412]|nr:hypothetical protein DL95DRAFT_498279 [Leptodontidium sp. 2 PMI_412]